MFSLMHQRPPLTVTQLPIEGWLLFLIKTVFDRELSISENSVRPACILHNASLIMGKQIINILPEGYVPSIDFIIPDDAKIYPSSATLNPDRLSFCIDSAHPYVKLP